VSDLDRAKYFRNKIANNYMGDIDYVYGDYTDALFTGKGWESFIGDATALGFSTASTISAVARTKTILSALGSAVTGISLSADKNFFSQQTFQAGNRNASEKRPSSPNHYQQSPTERYRLPSRRR
jgi:hypothetical protein